MKRNSCGTPRLSRSAALVVRERQRLSTRALQSDAGFEEALSVAEAEGIDLGGEALREMGVAEVLAHSILGLLQGVVVAVPRARLGEFYPQPVAVLVVPHP
jgi:hypothetical protein